MDRSGELTTRPMRAADASMDLLNQIIRQPIDPDYAATSARRPPTPRWHVTLAVVCLVIGSMFAIAALQTTRSATDIEKEREELITRIKTAQDEQNQLRDQASALAEQNNQLRVAGLGSDDRATELASELNSLELQAGAQPVVGPGLVITVDDGPGQDAKSQVLDTDLQVMVNGLWAAGAEAITINDQRLTTVTAIRTAGQAITVNYRSLTPPYRVQAIGDLRTLQARYVQSSGGTWWNALKSNVGVRYDIDSSPHLSLAGDPSITLRYAGKPEK